MEAEFEALEGERGGETGVTPHFVLEEIIQENKLTLDEASRCLNTLGKDESGVRYAYLMLSAKDMKLTDISVIENFNHLLFVDVSGNLLNSEALEVVAKIPFLLYLRAERNRLESGALPIMPYLQVLILNKNAITEAGDIGQPILDVLEIANNELYTIQFDPDRLESVKDLILSGNHLLDTAGNYPKNVEKLFLGYNKISKLNADFNQLTKLQYFHIRGNNIRKLNGFTSDLENLSYLNLRANKITKLREFRKLACLPKLDTLIVLENPVYKGLHEGFEGEGGSATEETDNDGEMVGEGGRPVIDVIRVRLLAMLPNLKRINKELVSIDEQELAQMNRHKLLNEIYAEESSDDETELPTSTTMYTTEYSSDNDLDVGHPVSEKSGEEQDEDEN